ncbi:LuxR C-terminal-related transcriptional regulator [Streptomyces sp. NPDC019224]|uniref:response regulator transcription factor n=1 Tax=Streptomyces sp. NPDC019224 TaxID=3154484 RepID=UPI0033C4DB06
MTYRVGIRHGHPLVAWAMEHTLAAIPAMHVSVLEGTGTDHGAKTGTPPPYDVLVTDHVPAGGMPPGVRTLLMSPTCVVAPGVDAWLPDRSSPEDFVRAVLGAAGKARSSAGPAPHPGRLSPREREVLDLIADGFTHAQTARRLGISRHTVDTHVKRIRSKSGVGNKADMVRLAMTPDRS